MKRPFNFSAGPATLPEEVLQRAAGEMLDWHGSGISVMEMSHRGAEFQSIIAAAMQDFRDLLAIPDNYKILFLQGGAIAQNAIIPMNLLGRCEHPATVDFIHTGYWSGRSIKEFKKYGNAHIAASSEPDQFTRIPSRDSWALSKDAAYIHLCSNETVHGVEFPFDPDTSTHSSNTPLVADMSSNIFSRVIDISKYGVIFGGAQKNLGIAGLTFVIVREDLIGHAAHVCPSAFDWKNVAKNHSLYNTPPAYAIYMAGLMLQWIKEQGGVAAIEQVNITKAALLYDYLDETDFYSNPVDHACRSRMNVPFFLRDASLNDVFLTGAKERGLIGLRGHRMLGGMRASLYNAMPITGVQALVNYLQEFAQSH